MKIVKRIKRLWDLSKKDKESLDYLLELEEEKLADLPDNDQKAVFFGQGTEEEWKEEENDKKGIKGIFGL